MKTKAFKKALAILLAVMLALPTSILTAVVSNAVPATVTAGELVAQNYASLTDAEKAVLTSGLVIGNTYQYTAPADGEALISVDTGAQTFTADNYTADSFTWIPVSATVEYDGGTEDVAVTGGAGNYSYDGGAFALSVDYQTEVGVDADLQAKLLNGPARLAKGIENVNAFADEFATFDALGENIGIFVGMTDTSNSAGHLGNQATVDAINALADEVSQSPDECLAILSYALDYLDNYEGSEAAFLLDQGLNFKTVAVSTYDRIKTIVDDTQINSFINNLDAQDKLKMQRVMSAMADLLANTQDAAEDSWAILDNSPFKSGLTTDQLRNLSSLAAAITDPAEHNDPIVSMLALPTATVSKNVNQYDVTVSVNAYVVPLNQVDSADLSALDEHSAVIKVYEGTSKAEALQAIEDNGIIADALAAWGVIDDNYQATVSDLPDTISGNVTYTVAYIPKNVSVTYGFTTDLPVNVPYGYNLTLPSYADDTQVYDYVVNGVEYDQGATVRLTGATAITRTQGDPWDSSKLNAIVAANYGETLTDDEAEVLTSLAVNSANIRFRTPSNGDGLVTVTHSAAGYTVNAAPYASGIAGISWEAERGVAYLGGDEVIRFPIDNGTATFDVANVDNVEVEYKMVLTNVTDAQITAALNVPATLADEAESQLSALDLLNSSYSKLAELDKKTLNQIQVGVKGSDMSDESKAAAVAIVNSCVDRNAGALYLIEYLDGYRANGLAYYYQNDVAFRTQIEILYTNLNTIYNDPELHNLLVDIGYEEYEEKIEDIITKLATVRADLVAPNDAINLASPSLAELAGTLEDLAGNGRALTSSGDPLVVTANVTAPAPGYSVITLNVVEVNSLGETIVSGTDTVIVNSENALSAADVDDIEDLLALMIASNGIDTAHYETSDTLGINAGDIVAADVTVTVTYAPKTYDVIFTDGTNTLGQASFPYDRPTVTLPACNESGKTYEYNVAGTIYTVRETAKTVTFTAAQIDNGSYTPIVRTVSDYRHAEFLELIENLNKAMAKAGLLNGSGNLTLAFLPMEDANGDLDLLLRVSPDNFSLLDEGAIKLAEEMTGSDFKYITLDGEYLREDSQFSLQTIVDALLNSGLRVDDVFEMITPEGDIIESTLTGYTVVGAVNNNIPVGGYNINDTDVVGAIFYETEMTFATDENAEPMNVKLYVSLEDFDQSADDLKSARKVATQIRNHGDIILNNGTVEAYISLTDRQYQAYLGAMLILDESDLSIAPFTMTDRSPSIVLDALETIVNDKTITMATYENTADKLGFDFDGSDYAGYYSKAVKIVKNLLKYISFSNENFYVNGYDADLNYDVTALLDQFNVSDSLRGVIKEKDTGINAAVSVQIGQVYDYEALIVDTGKSGADQVYFTTDVAAAAAALKGDSAVILLKDISGSITMNKGGTFDLNGHDVGGDLTFAGKTVVVDSRIETASGAYVSGTVSGQPTITGGAYADDVSAFLPDGYVLDNGQVRNGYFYILGTVDGYDIHLTPDDAIFDASSEETVTNIAYEIAADLALNYYFSAELNANGETVYSVNFDNVLALADNVSEQEANDLLDMIDCEGITALANELIDAACDFTALGTAVNNGTAVLTYQVETKDWDVEVEHIAAGDYLTINVAPSADKGYNTTYTVYVDNNGSMGDNLVALGTIATADADVALTDISWDYANDKVDVTGNGSVALDVDLTEDEDFAIAIGVILADGITDATKKAALVDAIETYYEDGTLGDLKAAFEAVTVREFLDAFSSDTAFNNRVSNIGLSGTVASSVNDIDETYKNLVKVLVKALDGLTGEGTQKTLGDFETANYGEYASDRANEVFDREEDRFYGEFTLLSSELTVKIFPDYKVLTRDSSKVEEYKGDSFHDGFVAHSDGSTLTVIDNVASECAEFLNDTLTLKGADLVDFTLGGFVLSNVDAELTADYQITDYVSTSVENYEVKETDNLDGTFTYTVEEIKYTLTFDANGGTINGEPTEEYQIAYLETYRSATGWTDIVIPVRDGYRFEGWDYQGVYRMALDDQYGLQSDGTFTATWTKLYNLTFDANGGTILGEASKTYQIANGESYESATGSASIIVPVRDHYNFVGWVYGGFYTLSSMQETYGLTTDGTFVAQWEEITYTLTFDANGGTINGQPTEDYQIAYLETYRSATGWTDIVEPVRPGYRFEGWDYQGFYRMALDDQYGLQSDGTFTATWTKLYNLTFDANGGTILGEATKTYEIANGESYESATGSASIIVPVRSGYTFTGWVYGGFYTLSSMQETYGLTTDGTFVAQWEAIPTVEEGFIIHVDWLDETVKDVIVLSNEPGDTAVYDDYESVKYRNGQAAPDPFDRENNAADDVAVYWYRVTQSKFMRSSQIDPEGHDHYFNFKVDHESAYTVFIRYIDDSVYVYTETVTASGDANVTTNGQRVTVELPDTNTYDLKTFIYAPGEGYRTRNEVKNASGAVSVSASKFAGGSYSFNVTAEGTYTYVAHFIDETWEIGTFTVTTPQNVDPVITSTQITNISSSLNIIRYMAGDHSDLTMSQAKASGATAITMSAVSGGVYNFRRALPAGTYTFFLHFNDTNVERAIVVTVN